MKFWVYLFAAVTFLVGLSLVGCKGKFQIQDRQVAAGEWLIEVQTPPCDPKAIQVDYPAESGTPITIKCNSMPVAAR